MCEWKFEWSCEGRCESGGVNVNVGLSCFRGSGRAGRHYLTNELFYCYTTRARLAREVLVEQNGGRPRRGAQHGGSEAGHLRVRLLGGEAVCGRGGVRVWRCGQRAANGEFGGRGGRRQDTSGEGGAHRRAARGSRRRAAPWPSGGRAEGCGQREARLVRGRVRAGVRRACLSRLARGWREVGARLARGWREVGTRLA